MAQPLPRLRPELSATHWLASCLIHQASYLLDQQVRRLEHFIKEGGFRERMTKARLQSRS